MGINITLKVSRNKEKKWYTLEWGKQPDQRKAAGVFTKKKLQQYVRGVSKRQSCF